MSNDHTGILRETWLRFVEALSMWLPRVLSMLVLLIAGWLIALAVRAGLRWLLRVLRFNTLLERAGVDLSLARLGGRLPDQVVGSVVFWVVWLTFLLSGLRALGVAAADRLVEDLIRFVPRLVGALAIVIIGFAVANFLWRAVLLAAVNARIQQARLLGALVRWLTLTAAVAMGLEQIGVGGTVLLTGFAIVFGGLVLAGAIAFGLGGRHAARRYLEERLLARDQKDTDGASHL